MSDIREMRRTLVVRVLEEAGKSSLSDRVQALESKICRPCGEGVRFRLSRNARPCFGAISFNCGATLQNSIFRDRKKSAIQQKRAGQSGLLPRKEVIDGLLDLRELKQLHNIDATIAALASREEVRRTAHDGGYLMLCQASLFPCRNQPL